MKALKEIRKEAVLKAFIDLKGNKTHTAKALGIGLRTVQRNLVSYGIGISRKDSLTGQLEMAERLLGKEGN